MLSTNGRPTFQCANGSLWSISELKWERKISFLTSFPAKTSLFSWGTLYETFYKRLLKGLNNFDWLPQIQTEYRQINSVITALCIVYNDLICSKAEGKCSIIVLLDISAAFDTVDHQTCTLLGDLENLGITWFALSWFKIYLTDRNCKCIVNDEESEIGNMKYGGPQGTILGPVLFIIYRLTLQYMLNYYIVSYQFYANDTKIYSKLDSKDQCVSKLKCSQCCTNVDVWKKTEVA